MLRYDVNLRLETFQVAYTFR
ncbi:hypothetical protein MTBLM5_40115 [Magnetospirillum sp. LM-5]|nr:hypothetical protein MTBLM5_40115 [Magnetospirillum sp. LM-5]